MRQVPLAFGPEPVLRFDTFLPGGNAQWEQVLMALLSPSPSMQLYLWGPPCSGKTLLLQAAVSQAQGGEMMGVVTGVLAEVHQGLLARVQLTVEKGQNVGVDTGHQ